MNKRFIIIIIVFAAAVILALSFGMKKVAHNAGSGLFDKIHSESKKDLLNLAKNYEAKNKYAKAREAFGKFIKKFPHSEDIRNARKAMERLNMEILFSSDITDDDFSYEIKPGDTLAGIASRFNTTVFLLRKSNGLKSDVILPGKFLKINKIKFDILVDKSENILELRKSGGEIVKTYIISTGENLSTPTGTFKIEEKLISPVWYKGVGAAVSPDSPEYELGSRWMGISVSGYGIHGTNNASSIGRHITRGCIRMKNPDVEELYAIVPSGTEVTIVE